MTTAKSTPNTPNTPNITIPQFYSGKNVFVTGGSGFMGKVLIEKLLRACPDLGKMYVLLRPKKGKNIRERLEEITSKILFNKLKEENPEALNKLIPIEGDIQELRLGLSESDRQMLLDEVHVIYHSGASVKFDDFLRDAILINTRSTREVAYLALEAKHLEVFVHVSTSYSNCDRFYVEEKIYPPHADWRQAIELAENCDFDILNVLNEKYKGKLPNNYTFTKSMAEHVVNDLCDGKIPAIILRPSIVCPTYKDPFPGWIDNFYGPVGMCVATGKGILRSVYTKPTTKTEYVTCDTIIRVAIALTWLKATETDPKLKLQTDVYNASNNDVKPINYKELMDYGSMMYKELPLNNVVWYPHNEPTACWYVHFYKLLFYQLLPALLIDGILKLVGKKPLLFKLHRRIYIANMALQYFLNADWTFVNDKCKAIDGKLLPQDYDSFVSYSDYEKLDVFTFFWQVKQICRKVLLKESDESFEDAKRHTMRMWYLYIICNVLWYVGLFWLVFVKLDVLGLLYGKINDGILYFTTP